MILRNMPVMWSIAQKMYGRLKMLWKIMNGFF